MPILGVRQLHFGPTFITIYSLRIVIDQACMLKDDNHHHIKKSPSTRTISHKMMELMLMSLRFDKLCRTSASIMCIATAVVESLKYLDLIKYDCRFIKQRLIMVSMSKCIKRLLKTLKDYFHCPELILMNICFD